MATPTVRGKADNIVREIQSFHREAAHPGL